MMKYYKKNNEIFAFELDGSQDHLIKDKVKMTEDEINLHINPPFTEEQRVSEIKAEAGRIIFNLYPQFKQMNAQLGIYGQSYLDEMIAFITNIKTQSDSFELDISKTKDDFVC